MRRKILLVGLMCFSVMAFGQKKEIRKAARALSSGNASEAMSFIQEAEGMLSQADNNLKADFYVTKAEVYLADAGKGDFDKMKEAASSVSKAEELGLSGNLKERVAVVKQNLRVALVNSAIEDQNRKNYDLASKKLYESYTVMKDTSDLYYAAGNAVNARDYPTALKYYTNLLDMGYTGIRQEWFATETETGKTVYFGSKADRDTNMLTGIYTNPGDQMSESVRSDILQKVVLIYISQGENEKALALMKDARAANPNDTGLLRAEADMAYKMGDMKKYNLLMEEVIASDPNNPELYYNLGVGSANNNEPDKALEYYKKALELDPGFTNAKINIAATMLSKEGPIVEEMNNLGTSKADFARYDELKEVRNKLYKDALPYLESAVNDRPKNVELVRTLMNIYSQLGMDAQYKESRSRLSELEGGN